VAGTKDAVLMVESEAQELSEEVMLGSVMFGHKHFQPVIQAIIRLAEKAAKEPRELNAPDNSALKTKLKGLAEADLRAAYGNKIKQDRYNAVGAAKKKAKEAILGDGANPDAPSPSLVGEVLKELEADIVRNSILDTGIRIDGRDVKTVRPIESLV